ncbi:ABC transporter permease [Nocardioides sp. S-58]|uniref:Transport permease protein n=1 Tax=Nocardioides renjunii TaxID=3095075 RepID=A0ABU5K9N8_9ACTN|nr:ABC transporter permease [Nocardioides sp. S-58]MDZ5661692.1 ABC transporter permease [Nocardioides sp. S-58]
MSTIHTSPTHTLASTARESWLVTGRDLRHWLRDPWTPVFGMAFSVMLVLVFGYLFGGAVALPGGGDYLAYLLPGMLALSMMFGVESTMAAMATDSRRGVMDRFRSLPMSGVAVPLGRAMADLLNSAVQLAVLMGGGLLIGWSVSGSLLDAFVAVGLLLWLRFAVLWLGIFLGLAFRSEGAMVAVQVLVWPIGFLSGVIVPPETMPGWLGVVADLNPVSATAAACRELFGNPSGITEGLLADHALLLAVAWPAVLTAVFVPLSVRAFRRLGA